MLKYRLLVVNAGPRVGPRLRPPHQHQARVVRVMTGLLVLAALTAEAALPRSLVHADPPAAAPSEAHRRFQLGVQHFQAGRYAEALGNFEHAYRLKPHPLVRVNIANCYDKLQRPVEAIDAFEAFLATHEGTEQQRHEVEQAVDRLSKQLARLVLRVHPPSALSRVDDDTDARPGARWLVPGPHRLIVSAEGYQNSTRSVQMQAAEIEVVSVELAPNRDTLASEPIRSEPIVQPLTPLSTGPLLPDDPAKTAAAPAANHDHSSAPLWISGGATLVLGITALVTGQLALSANREFNTNLRAVRNPLLNEFQRAGAWSRGVDASDRAESLAAATDVLLGLTFAGVGLTAYLWLAGRAGRVAEQSHANASVRAEVLPGRVQLSAQF